MDLDWTHELVEQVDRHWRDQLRPRYDRLGDEEYLWEAVTNTWNLHPRGQGRTEPEYGGGELVIDFAHPEPVPAPVTTIAWRLAHVVVGVLGARVASHFGGPPMDYQTHHYAATAAGALQQLDEVYLAWREGVTALGDEGLARPCGAAEGPFAAYPMAALVLHVNREVLHHGAEIALLRDLYANR
jgi:DinB superfamily